MFDLKAKLLEKGLVTKEHVDRIAAEKKQQRLPKAESSDAFLTKERKRIIESLKSQNKSEAYTTIRKWVDINRLDKPSCASIDDEKFFLSTKDNQVTWLTLKKDVIDAIKTGKAGVIAYMSNHGLTHAVVPRDIAEDVAVIFPDWLRVLNDLC